nr:hypothetical protein [Tanacetum cinerariifolium]GEZ31744.1 hypothetical protein [Tanacetum cinerariifolium]
MSTPSYVDLETITQANGALSSRVPVHLPADPYVLEYPLWVRSLRLLNRQNRTYGRVNPTDPILGHVSPLSGGSCFCPHFLSVRDTKSEGGELGEDDTKEDESLDASDKRVIQGLDDEGKGLEDKGPGMEEEKEEATPEARRRALESIEDIAPSTYEVGQSSRSVPEQEGVERISAFRQPTLDTWVDPKDGKVCTDIPTYVPLAAHVQTPPSPEWSSSSLPILTSSQVVLSPIASPVATSTAIISRLDALPPTLFANIDKDVRELYTRSGAVKDEIFSQRPVLALKAWAGHVDTRMADMSPTRYDDHILIHDILVQQAAMQRELQEMRGRVTALELTWTVKSSRWYEIV